MKAMATAIITITTTTITIIMTTIIMIITGTIMRATIMQGMAMKRTAMPRTGAIRWPSRRPVLLWATMRTLIPMARIAAARLTGTITITSMAGMDTITTTSTADAAGALKLLAWLSPAFPVGSFAYSHGLEWAQEAGTLRDAAQLAAWIADLVREGSWRNEAILAAESHRAVMAGDEAGLADVAALAAALAPSAERRLETMQQGTAFLGAIGAAWPAEGIARLATLFPDEIAYPVALGAVGAAHGIALLPLLEAYGMAFVANLASAAIRLSMIGQTDGQRVMAALLPVVSETAPLLARASLDDLGGAAMRSDIASMQHETQYTRLFRS